MKPNLDWENNLGHPSLQIVGVDEVGRGCLAGPVVAGAVALPLSSDSFSRELYPWLDEITDSKCLKPETRERLAPLIEAWAPASAVGVASVDEIDTINIYHASHLAMRRAVEQVVAQLAAKGLAAVSHILIDGNALPKNLPAKATAVVKGDLQCFSIAASSIIAKVWRDREMERYEAQYPGYGLGVHKGYATPVHSESLKKLGATSIHRKSFAPVKAVLTPSQLAEFEKLIAAAQAQTPAPSLAKASKPAQKREKLQPQCSLFDSELTAEAEQFEFFR
ncbi:MAG: ribonuclease HII [Bdellovibrionia bacterium]